MVRELQALKYLGIPTLLMSLGLLQHVYQGYQRSV